MLEQVEILKGEPYKSQYSLPLHVNVADLIALAEHFFLLIKLACVIIKKLLISIIVSDKKNYDKNGLLKQILKFISKNFSRTNQVTLNK